MKFSVFALALAMGLVSQIASANYCDQYGFGSADWWRCMDQGKGAVDNSVACVDLIKSPKDFWECIERNRAFADNSVACANLVSNPPEFWACIERNGR